MKISSSRNLLCRKFPAVCLKITSPPFLRAIAMLRPS